MLMLMINSFHTNMSTKCYVNRVMSNVGLGLIPFLTMYKVTSFTVVLFFIRVFEIGFSDANELQLNIYKFTVHISNVYKSMRSYRLFNYSYVIENFC